MSFGTCDVKYTLFYFNARGRAEAARLILAQVGAKYKDVRFTGEEWQKEYKAKSPLGTAPWLEVDGKQIGGSTNIARFLGEEFNLAGSNRIENAQIAAICDTFVDFLNEATKCVFIKDESEKAKQVEEFKGKCDKWLGVLEKKITDKGWLYGDKLTWVDIFVAHGFTFLSTTFPDLLKSYPKLAALKTNVETQPNIAKWIKERPENAF